MKNHEALLDAVNLLDLIISRSTKAGFIRLSESDVQEARKLLEDVAAEEAQAFHEVSRGVAPLHFGFTERIDATIVSGALVSERIAFQDISVFQALLAISLAPRMPAEKIVEALNGFALFASNRTLRRALQEGIAVYAPHRDHMLLAAKLAGDDTLEKIANNYSTLQPAPPMINLRRVIVRYFGRERGYLADAIIFSHIARVESLTNDPHVREKAFKAAHDKTFRERVIALATAIGVDINPVFVDMRIDFLTRFLEHLESVIERSRELIIAEKLILDPLKQIPLISGKLKQCEERPHPARCTEAILEEAYLKALERIIELRKSGAIEVERLRQALSNITTQEDLEKAAEIVKELLIDRPRLYTLAAAATGTLVSALEISQYVAAAGDILLGAGTAATNITISLRPIEILIILLGAASTALTIKELKTNLHKIIKYVKKKSVETRHEIEATLGNTYSKAILQAYKTASTIAANL